MNFNDLEPKLKDNYAVTVTLPLEVLRKIDTNRTDVISRSKYIKKLLLMALGDDKEDENKR